MVDEDTVQASAKAIQEVAKSTGAAIELVQTYGEYLGEVFDTVPHDVVGLLGGDWLKIRRMENFTKIGERATARLAERGVEEREAISLRVGVPLLEAASMESSDELQDLWARLIANAMDPNRDVSLRNEYIEALRQFEPIDAYVLEEMVDATPVENPNIHIGNIFSLPTVFEGKNIQIDVVATSAENLVQVGCLKITKVQREIAANFIVTPFGRQLIRACQE